MTVKSGSVWSGMVVTRDATGALSAASAGPVGALYVNGVLNGADVTVTGTNPYQWTVTLPSLAAGDCVSLYITATISSVATASVVAEDVADTKRVSDLADEVIGTGVGLTALGDVRLATDAVDAASLATSAIAELIAALRSDGLVPAAASAVSAYRDVTLSLPLTATTAGYTKIYFTVKNDPDNDADSAAVIQVKKNSTGDSDGLIALAGSTTLPSGITAADGSIGIVGTTVTVTVSAAAMAKLDIRSNMWYDLKVLISNVWSITNRGLFHVISTATKSIS